MKGVAKPADLLFAVDERPPLATASVSALQYIALQLGYFAVPVAITRAAGLSAADTVEFLQLCWFVLGLSTLLQCWGKGGIGSGFLIVPVCTTIYLGPAIVALQAGGLPALAGGMIIAGLVELAVALVFKRIRWLFAPEVVGLLVLLGGLSAGFAGLVVLQSALGAASLQANLAITGVSLLATLIATVWARDGLRRNAALLGLVVGYLVAIPLGAVDLSLVNATVALQLPLPELSMPTFDPKLVLVFVVCAIISAFKAMGSVAAAQRANDRNWVRLESGSVRGGIAADGLGTVVAGLVGVTGVNASPGSVGLSQASGITSRAVAVPLAAVQLLAGLSGTFAALLAATPDAVLAATLVYSSIFVCVQGMQMITSRLLDQRRSIVVGMPFAVALATEARPGPLVDLLAATVPPGSMFMSVGAIGALTLHVISRVGIRETATEVLNPGPGAIAEACRRFNRFGEVQGARPQVVDRASTALGEALEMLLGEGLATGPVQVSYSFDEFNLNMTLTYPGRAPRFDGPLPDATALMEDPDAPIRLAAFMVSRNADQVKVQERDGICTLALHWDH